MNSDVFEKKVEENLHSLWDIRLFEYSLIAISSFLLISIFLFLSGFSIYLAALPAIAIAVSLHYLRGKYADYLKRMEIGNPRLKDSLKAAYDNKKKKNFIVKELVGDVGGELEKIDTEKFINLRRVGIYVAVSIISVFVLISLMVFGFEGSLGPGLFGSAGGGSGESGGDGSSGSSGGSDVSGEGETAAAQDTTSGLGASDDIYGDRSIATVEGEELELEIHPEYGEYGEIGGGAGAESAEANGGVGQIGATSSASYNENIPGKLESVVRGYFEKVSDS